MGLRTRRAKIIAAAVVFVLIAAFCILTVRLFIYPDLNAPEKSDAIVVTPTAQATRARPRIGRCYSGQILEVGIPTEGFWPWVGELGYEWAALATALVLQSSC